ncbi:MAG: Holliday junction resolvase RuvX [Proteobacteria bacterium]|nr:Holliday junction resolvase RuvX [Pseudomonadota bacterium]
MRYLGLDIGKKRIGVAISDEAGIIATPLIVVKAGSSAVSEITELAAEYGAKEIVLGMPLNMDGTRGDMANYVEKFIDKLARKYSETITTWDERLSTSAVTKVLIEGGARRSKRKTVVDKLSASYILQGYLDSKR